MSLAFGRSSEQNTNKSFQSNPGEWDHSDYLSYLTLSNVTYVFFRRFFFVLHFSEGQVEMVFHKITCCWLYRRQRRILFVRFCSIPFWRELSSILMIILATIAALWSRRWSIQQSLRRVIWWWQHNLRGKDLLAHLEDPIQITATSLRPLLKQERSAKSLWNCWSGKETISALRQDSDYLQFRHQI